MKHILLIFLATLSLNIIKAQDFKSKVLSSDTREPLSFATVKFGEHDGLITNEDGVFAITLNRELQPSDVLEISYMGYETKTLPLVEKLPETILLKPATFTLDEVVLTNNPLSTDEIIEKVKEHLHENYNQDLAQKKIFFRQSNNNYLDHVDFNIKESSIEELNQELFNSLSNSIPKFSHYYREVAGTLSGNFDKFRIEIDKGAELYDKSKDLSTDGITKKLEKIFADNVKPDSYLKIRSGIIGAKVDVDEIQSDWDEEQAKKLDTIAQPNKGEFYGSLYGSIKDLYQSMFFASEPKLDILEKSNRYRFSKRKFVNIDGEYAYVIDFEPKGGRDFEGTMYVNMQDFGIMRLDFKNVKRLSNFNLFGIVYRRTDYNGIMIFSKDANGKYNPKYLELIEGNYFKVDRPLTVIEKNKRVLGPKKQNELALDFLIDGRNYEKYEYVVFENSELDIETYESITSSKEFLPNHLEAYDPTYWDGYTIMEPNQAIQDFRVEK